MAVNITAMHRTPGYTNVRRLTPCVPAAAIRDRPVPSTNRNKKGCTSDVMMRRRSRLKRTSSRFHTTLIARASLRRLRAGTRTRATSSPPRDPGRAGRLGAVVVGEAIALLRRSPQRPIMRAKLRRVSMPVDSASRIVVPV